ncbi:rRNA maturation RNase YbeY [Rhodovulum sp. BSW8]|uniref:Endoribonuclease YbeY n=1 Tax=Rhodovulum visakhapatnamense TaxID=364297 RepID=A0ABS1RFC7_9RHOB|nr:MULTISPECIES: rRNA maturation RNase YbeY [Rhodovulum]MBL3569428.1 rRNA maturation RNase YbeY [Rhodovulum visakhapatnamense]MBL3578351.1 rRNA maturation RNase YbeY [Rhodovulum visakhapatnamense]OLS45890.1 rRNA maturation RNase YbeY [Rhodovulum sulfidophilum]RBO51591.1 rRNA maturation RNase YbeY [Rhodovulum sp. BSW8]
MSIEILFEDDRWAAAGLAQLAESACRETLTHLEFDPEIHEISVLACDDARIAILNAEFRDKPAPTNVLSWPAEDLAAEEDGEAPLLPEPDFEGEPVELGDIAIAWETCAREAREQGKAFNDHVTHLMVHGCLHLLGYDHIRPRDAARMEGIEVEILAKLGLADPYD